LKNAVRALWTPSKLFINKKFLEVQEPFYKKVLGRRRHNSSKKVIKIGWAGQKVIKVLLFLPIHATGKIPDVDQPCAASG